MSILITNKPGSSTSSSSTSASYDVLNAGLSSSVTSGVLTVNLTQGGGSAPAAGSGAVIVAFKSSAVGGGATTTYADSSITSALSISSISGATFGLISGQVSYLYVYLLNHLGTIELALSGTEIADESISQTTSTLGSGSTNPALLYSTTSRVSVFVRLIGKITLVQTAGTFFTPSNIAVLTNQPIQIRSYVRVWGSNGPSSTNSCILYYANVDTNIGTDIFYVNDSVNGDTFTIQRSGVYSGGITNYAGGSPEAQGMSKNSTQLSTPPNSITPTTILCETASVAASTPGSTSWTAFLNAGDVIRPHCGSGSSNNPTDGSLYCYVCRVG